MVAVVAVVHVVIMLDLLDEVLQGERIGALNGETETAGPDLSGHNTEGARDAEQNGVVVELVETVVHEEGAGAGVNVGPGVADLTGGLEHVGDHSVASLNEVNKVIVLDVLLSEVKLAHEARIGLTEDGVTVSGDDLAAGKGVLNIVSNVIFVPGLAELGLEVEEELEALLVGETVEGSSETVHTSGERKVGVREG